MSIAEQLTPEERVRLANRLYDEKLKGELEPTHRGKVVAIDVSSGKYFIGRDVRDACRKARSEYPRAVFVCRRVGNGPLYRVGAF